MKQPCERAPNRDHSVPHLHPAATSEEHAAEVRGTTQHLAIIYPPCGCRGALPVTLLEECDDCQESLNYASPDDGLWKCDKCGDRELQDLVILHGEGGAIRCISCFLGVPRSELPGGTLA